MKAADALSLWSSILKNDLEAPPTEAVLVELQRYCDLSLEEVRSRARQSPSETKGKWEAGDRSTAEGLQEFYDSVGNWVFGNLSYHARQAEGEYTPLPVEVAELLDSHEPGDFLDFGAGVATASLLFSKLGWRVTAADISAPLLEFARWRFRDRGVSATVIDLRHDRLPDEAYDVICAFNTMVHVPNPGATLRDLRRALKANGLVIFDVDTRPKSADMPWHLYERAYPVIRTVRRCGFARHSMRGTVHVFRRQEMSAMQRAAVGAYDFLRYSPAASWSADRYRKLGRLARRALAPAPLKHAVH